MKGSMYVAIVKLGRLINYSCMITKYTAMNLCGVNKATSATPPPTSHGCNGCRYIEELSYGPVEIHYTKITLIDIILLWHGYYLDIGLSMSSITFSQINIHGWL